MHLIVVNAEQMGKKGELYTIRYTILIQIPGIIIMEAGIAVARINKGDGIGNRFATDVKDGEAGLNKKFRAAIGKSHEDLNLITGIQECSCGRYLPNNFKEISRIIKNRDRYIINFIQVADGIFNETFHVVIVIDQTYDIRHGSQRRNDLSCNFIHQGVNVTTGIGQEVFERRTTIAPFRIGLNVFNCIEVNTELRDFNISNVVIDIFRNILNLINLSGIQSEE